MKKKELYEIAKKLGIKYLTWMNKKQMIKEIEKIEDLPSDYDKVIGEYKGKYMCEHKRQKYKCVDCGGKHICEHKKQRPACKICRKGNF